MHLWTLLGYKKKRDKRFSLHRQKLKAIPFQSQLSAEGQVSFFIKVDLYKFQDVKPCAKNP